MEDNKPLLSEQLQIYNCSTDCCSLLTTDCTLIAVVLKNTTFVRLLYRRGVLGFEVMAIRSTLSNGEPNWNCWQRVEMST